MKNRSALRKGVALQCWIALLVGVLWTPGPTLTRADLTIGQGICAILTLGVCVAFFTYDSFGTTPGIPGPVPTTCTPPRLTGLPNFINWPKGSVKYPFDGICTSPQKPEAQMKYRWEGSWSPSEKDPNKPNASESVEITGYQPFIPGRESGGRNFLYWTARCNRDPWLSEISASCQRLGAYIPLDLSEAAPDLQTTFFPKTRDLIQKNNQSSSMHSIFDSISRCDKVNPLGQGADR